MSCYFSSKCVVYIASCLIFACNLNATKHTIVANNIWLEVRVLELPDSSEISDDLMQVSITFRYSIPESFQAEILKNVYVGKRQGEEDIDACLDGLGHDVSLILQQEETRSEIFFGCNEFKKGTLRKGNDFSMFWDVHVENGFLEKFTSFIKRKKDISKYRHNKK